MVTSEKWFQRKLHTFVGRMRGRENTCLSQKHDGSFSQKIDYKSQATAAKSALKLSEKFGKNFDAYQCWWCKGWHIGATANLTVIKFLSILWIYLRGKRRLGNKHRLKFYVRTKMVKCQRCDKETNITILSMYNTEEICIDCKATEEKRPDYDEAVKADQNAIATVDYAFRGIGLR